MALGRCSRHTGKACGGVRAARRAASNTQLIDSRSPMADDPVLLITGASSGIGAATARHASRAGYRVVLAARSQDKLAALASELGGDERALAVGCDVSEWSDQEAMVARALEAYGRLDVAFANAGFGAARGFTESSPEHWKSMVLTNVYGAALTIRATLPALKDTRGHLLLTGSVRSEEHTSELQSRQYLVCRLL